MLQDKAMLANLTIRAWSARKRDKDVGREIETQHQAKNAGNFNKLLIDSVALKPINTIAGMLRDMHYKMTLPWGDNGDRLLPAKMYLEYCKVMRGLEDDFAQAVKTFCANYPTYRTEARKRLGTMYDPADYPDASKLASKFEARKWFLGVPNADDFRVDLGEDEVATIKQDIQRQVAAQQEGAVRDLWERLREVVERIHERLSDPEAIFRDSLIENAQFATSIAMKLNINDDPKLEAVRADIEHRLCKVEPQRLRDDMELRARVATSAEEILRTFPKWD